MQINATYLWNFLEASLRSLALVQRLAPLFHQHIQFLWMRGHGHLAAAMVQQLPWLPVSHEPPSLARGLGHPWHCQAAPSLEDGLHRKKHYELLSDR
jgi:hypothetical protein